MAEKQKPMEKKIESKKTGMIAVVRIRGEVMISRQNRDTLHMLHLHKRNYAAVFDGRPETMGMINKVKDHITWGEIDDETLKLLNEKRKEGEKKFYRLAPPRKGFERKGIKVSFKSGGALGYRGVKINDLIRKMV